MKSSSIIHFMQVPFTGLGTNPSGVNGYRGDEWFKNRIAIFKRFVIPSLLNQTNPNFYVWLNFRPEEEQNPICQEFIQWMHHIRLNTVVSYGGCPFYDDKFDDGERLKERLKIILPPLTPVIGDTKWVYVTIQPSDDLYLGNAVADLQSIKPRKKLVIGWQKGYIMDYGAKTLAEYNPKTNPPFFTIVFPAKEFLDPDRHWKYIGPYQSHEYIANYMDHYEELADRAFIVGTHGENISTTFNIPYKGQLIEGESRDRVLLKAGIYFAESYQRPMTTRIRWRTWFNRLPASLRQRLRPLYWKLPWVY